MMRFVFPALFAVIIALLFFDFYSLSRSLREFDLPEPLRPNPLQVLTPAPAPDVTHGPKLDAVATAPAPSPDVTPEPKLDAIAATPAPAPDVTPEPELDGVAATPAPAPDVTPEPKLDATAATPAPAHDVTLEPELDAVAATPAPAPDVTPEAKLDAAPKAQSAPEVLRKVEPAASRARVEAPPKKKRVTATGPTGAAGATTGRERARPPERDFGQAATELPPQ
jgi:hypothetical protein